MSEDKSARAVEALAEFLLERDYPREPWAQRRNAYSYRCRAAAILNGEEWALRKAWPIADRFPLMDRAPV